MLLPGPSGEPLPFAYRWAVANGLTSFTPWHLLTSPDEAAALRRQFVREFSPGTDCWPIARRQDMDEMAGFLLTDGRVEERVVSVHLTWGAQMYPLSEQAVYADFWAWLTREVSPTMAGWGAGEVDVEELLRDRSA